jgi:hypothetical protein
MEDRKYTKMLKMVKECGKTEQFNNIMNDYFDELEKYHPQTYNNLIGVVNKLGAKINICSKKELDEYLDLIHHKDVPQLWTLEQTSKVAKDIGIDFNKWSYNEYTFNYVMNMMRSDYYSEFKQMFSSSPLMKQAVLDSPSFYAHLSKAWLNDEDAPADKLIKYIGIIKGEEKSEEN